jgi:hypothetical protein
MRRIEMFHHVNTLSTRGTRAVKTLWTVLVAAVVTALLMGNAPGASALYTEATGSGFASFGGKPVLKVAPYDMQSGGRVYAFSTSDMLVRPVEGVPGAQQVKVTLTLLQGTGSGGTISWAAVGGGVDQRTLDLGDGSGGSVAKTLRGGSFFHFETPGGSAAAYKVVARFEWFSGATRFSERVIAASLASELSCGTLPMGSCFKIAQPGQLPFLVVV